MYNRLVAIVLTYNDHLTTLSLVEQLILDEITSQIVVVDNSDNLEIIQINKKSFSELNKVHYIKSSINGGYAHGNNIGIKYALNQLDAEYIWILNNDIIVQHNSSKAMLDEIIENGNKTICGSILYYYNGSKIINENSIIQCYGGVNYLRFLGKSTLFHKGKRKVDMKTNLKQPDFIMGASLMVSKSIFADIGYIPEEYFMYNEEIDWQICAKKIGYKVHVAINSEVIHLDSLSTKGKKSSYYFYLNRSNLILSKKYYKQFIVFVFLFSTLSCLRIPGRRNKLAGIKGLMEGVKI